MRDYKTTALVGTPELRPAHRELPRASRASTPTSCACASGLFGAESWSEAMRDEIERGLHIKAYDNYGLTELIGPGVAFECSERGRPPRQRGPLHHRGGRPQDASRPCRPARRASSSSRLSPSRASPSSATGRATSRPRWKGACPCGRKLARMRRVSGRIDDMIIVDGVNVFPSQIEEAVLKVEGVAPHYRIVVDRAGGLDVVEVQAEVSPGLPRPRRGGQGGGPARSAPGLDRRGPRLQGARGLRRARAPSSAPTGASSGGSSTRGRSNGRIAVSSRLCPGAIGPNHAVDRSREVPIAPNSPSSLEYPLGVHHLGAEEPFHEFARRTASKPADA